MPRSKQRKGDAVKSRATMPGRPMTPRDEADRSRHSRAKQMAVDESMSDDSSGSSDDSEEEHPAPRSRSSPKSRQLEPEPEPVDGAVPVEPEPEPVQPAPTMLTECMVTACRQREARLAELEAENLALKQELAVYRRAVELTQEEAQAARLQKQQSTVRHAHQLKQINQQHADEIHTSVARQLQRSLSDLTRDGGWVCDVGSGEVPFDAKHNDILNSAFAERSIATFERDGWEYTVDFSRGEGYSNHQALTLEFEQTNEATGVRRKVRWLAGALDIPRWPLYFGPSAPSQPGCAFQLERITDGGMLEQLRASIQPADPAQLGCGADVPEGVKRFWADKPRKTRSLSLEHAWRLQHSSLWMRYLAARQGVKTGMARVPEERRHFLGRSDGTMAPAFAEMTANLEAVTEPLDEEANEAYLLTGLPASAVLEVLEGGFNEKYSVNSSFGSGCYFAEDAAKNDQYTGEPGQEPAELRELLFGAGVSTEDKPETAGLNYLMLCRVSLGCSIRTNGKGRLLKVLDEGVVSVNREGMTDAVFWSSNDEGPITQDDVDRDGIKDSDGNPSFDPHDHPDYERRNHADTSQWRELGRVAGVENPSVAYHSLVVETSERDEEADAALDRGFSSATLVNHGMLGGVERFREFVVFHAERIYPEYLLAYRRGGGDESPSEPEPEPEPEREREPEPEPEPGPGSR